MRIEFYSRLAMMVVAAFLIIATQVWPALTVEWMFIIGGVVLLVLAAADGGEGNRRQRALDGIVALLAVWTVVQAVVFAGDTLIWVSFATALGAFLVAMAGLIDHETSTERVVHELQVTPASARPGAFAS